MHFLHWESLRFFDLCLQANCVQCPIQNQSPRKRTSLVSDSAQLEVESHSLGSPYWLKRDQTPVSEITTPISKWLGWVVFSCKLKDSLKLLLSLHWKRYAFLGVWSGAHEYSCQGVLLEVLLSKVGDTVGFLNPSSHYRSLIYEAKIKMPLPFAFPWSCYKT